MNKDKILTVGIITYDCPHLKTEQVVHKLIRSPAYHRLRLRLIALPFVPRPERAVVLQHRPKQSESVATEDLAASNGLEFIRYATGASLPDCDYYVIAGAGLLPADVIRGRKIVNAHAGIIPSARGLDSFKWSILRGIPLGVTLHFIDEAVDEGEIIAIAETPIYITDSLATLARRHYELEIDLLGDFLRFIEEPRKAKAYERLDAKKRMSPEAEREMVREFDAYKAKHAIQAPSPSHQNHPFAHISE